jgi:hypothetical protein
MSPVKSRKYCLETSIGLQILCTRELLHDLEGSNVAERSASGVAAGAISLQVVYTADHEKVRSELGAANDPCIQ